MVAQSWLVGQVVYCVTSLRVLSSGSHSPWTSSEPTTAIPPHSSVADEEASVGAARRGLPHAQRSDAREASRAAIAAEIPAGAARHLPHAGLDDLPLPDVAFGADRGADRGAYALQPLSPFDHFCSDLHFNVIDLHLVESHSLVVA